MTFYVATLNILPRMHAPGVIYSSPPSSDCMCMLNAREPISHPARQNWIEDLSKAKLALFGEQLWFDETLG